jgi:hypothetical protein
MRRNVLLTGGIIAGALALGLATAPVLANARSSASSAAPGQVWAMGGGGPAGAGRGAAGHGMPGRNGMNGAGALAGAAAAPSGTLTAAQSSALASMAEDEKLAHDVYAALATSSGDVRFTRIAAAENQHLTAIRTMLQRYGVTDPTSGRAEGSFATPATQKLHDDLVAQGRASATAALQVGRTIEKLDIADLDKASAGLTAPDVATVYSRLRAASQQHLATFGG